MAFLMLAAAFVGFATVSSEPYDRNNHTNCTHRHNNVLKPHPDQFHKQQKSTRRMSKSKESDAVAPIDDWEKLEIVRDDALNREEPITQFLGEFFVNTDGEITSLQTNFTHRHNNVLKPHPDQFHKQQKSTRGMSKSKESDAVVPIDDWEKLEIVRDDALHREDPITQFLTEFFVNTDGEITSLQTNFTHRHNNVLKPHPDQFHKQQKSTRGMSKSKESDAVVPIDDWEKLEIVRDDALHREDPITQFLTEFFVNTDGEITSLQATQSDDENYREGQSIRIKKKSKRGFIFRT